MSLEVLEMKFSEDCCRSAVGKLSIAVVTFVLTQFSVVQHLASNAYLII